VLPYCLLIERMETPTLSRSSIGFITFHCCDAYRLTLSTADKMSGDNCENLGVIISSSYANIAPTTTQRQRSVCF
jgi:hypothetical protein